jgi:hypothetical protein
LCPRCDNDISAEQAKLNLPDYRAEPPFLLGTLTGEADEYSTEVEADYPVGVEAYDSEIDLSLEGLEETAYDQQELDKAEKITLIIDKKKGKITSQGMKVSQ